MGDYFTLDKLFDILKEANIDPSECTFEIDENYIAERNIIRDYITEYDESQSEKLLIKQFETKNEAPEWKPHFFI